jgi:general secretion pathway protein D
MGKKQDLAAIEEIVKNMDMMLLQVMIEAVIVQIDLDDTVSSGIQWIQRALIVREQNARNGVTAKGSVAGSMGSGVGDLITGLYSSAGLTSLGDWAASGGLNAYFTIFGLNMDAIIKILESDSRNKILSSPRIVTTDNTKAKIESTEQRYFLKGTTVLNETIIRPETEIKDIGLTLEFTPHINAKKNVLLEISQNISEVSGTQDIGDQGKWPITKKRNFSASIAVRDKETIVLGGLIRKVNSNQESGVPILGRIPLIGRLFSYRSDSDQRAEMVVFITPYVLDTPEEIERQALKHKEAVNPKDLWQSDWSGSKLAEPTKKDRDAAKAEEKAKARRAASPLDMVDPEFADFIRKNERDIGPKMKEAEKSVEKDIIR